MAAEIDGRTAIVKILQRVEEFLLNFFNWLKNFEDFD